jgi:hypothetical protein
VADRKELKILFDSLKVEITDDQLNEIVILETNIKLNSSQKNLIISNSYPEYIKFTNKKIQLNECCYNLKIINSKVLSEYLAYYLINYKDEIYENYFNNNNNFNEQINDFVNKFEILVPNLEIQQLFLTNTNNINNDKMEFLNIMLDSKQQFITNKINEIDDSIDNLINDIKKVESQLNDLCELELLLNVDNSKKIIIDDKISLKKTKNFKSNVIIEI